MGEGAYYEPEGEADPGSWTFCEYPERVPDENCSIHDPSHLCRGCIIWAEAALMRGDVPGIGHYLDAVGEYEARAS